MKTNKNIIKVKLKEKIIVEAVREKGQGVWEGKKKENLSNGYSTNAWNEDSPEGPSLGPHCGEPNVCGSSYIPREERLPWLAWAEAIVCLHGVGMWSAGTDTMTIQTVFLDLVERMLMFWNWMQCQMAYWSRSVLVCSVKDV